MLDLFYCCQVEYQVCWKVFTLYVIIYSFNKGFCYCFNISSVYEIFIQ